MIFGKLPLNDAEGAILAHSLRLDGGGSLKKGHILTAKDIGQLREAGIDHVRAARPEFGEVHEDTAAARIAGAVSGPGTTLTTAFTGRVNIFSQTSGLVNFSAEKLRELNRLDEAATIATLPNHSRVAAEQMVATVKIIPFAVPEALVAAWESNLAADQQLRCHSFTPRSAWLIQTQLAGTKESVLDKTAEITRQRCAALEIDLTAEKRCAHDEAALGMAIAEARSGGARLILIAGATAITDRRDVLPAAIAEAGGEILQFGMPVDPGNLLLLARLGEADVLGLPGCARSPKLNGLDWVLQRIAADQRPSALDIRDMGVGGLLTEIESRPLPRRQATKEPDKPPKPRKIAAIVLAAGQSRRMGTHNKLLLPLQERPLIAYALEAAASAGCAPISVVTGHEAQAVTAAADAALGPGNWQASHNPDYADGLSTSLRTGILDLPDDCDAAVILLGDMPLISAALLKRLMAAYRPEQGARIVVPTVKGKRGNPVLFDRAFFPAMLHLKGDVGAKPLIGDNAEAVAEVAIDDAAALTDVDTPEAFDNLSGTRS